MTPIDSSLLAGAFKRSSCWCAWWPVSNVLVVFVTRTSLLHDMLSSLGRAYPDSGDISGSSAFPPLSNVKNGSQLYSWQSDVLIVISCS